MEHARGGTCVAAIVAAATFAACSGGSSAADTGSGCNGVSPCGGALTGTWTITSACGQPDIYLLGMECPGALLDQSGLVMTGTVTFNADMTYLFDITRSGTMKQTITLGCPVLPYTSCDELASAMALTTCTTTGSVCHCSTIVTPMRFESRGQFSTEGNAIIYPLSPTPGSQGYCVQGDTLHLLNLDPPTGRVIGDMVAIRAATDGGQD